MRTVIVYGPPASGKTSNAEALRKMYGCQSINDEGKILDVNFRIKEGCLNLVLNPPDINPLDCEVISIFDALTALHEKTKIQPTH